MDATPKETAVLYTQKTGVPVYVPLPPFVVEALEACPRLSERYWFWTGVGLKETLAGNWRRTFRRLCEIAGVQGGHPHHRAFSFAGGLQGADSNCRATTRASPLSASLPLSSPGEARDRAA
jgi:hypothetical protein